MSLTSFDGLLPSTFKKLLAGELPDLKSSHVSEAMAAGCGYPNNAAYLADLKSGSRVDFVPVDRIDAMAMSQRLIEIVGGEPPAVVDRVAGALMRIRAHVGGDIVPIGTRSSIERARPIAIPMEQDDLVDAILDAIEENEDAEARSTGSTEHLVRALVPAVRRIVHPRRFYINHLSEALQLDLLVPIGTGAYRALPRRVQNGVLDYLRTLDGFDETDLRQTRGVRAQHVSNATAVHHAIHRIVDRDILPNGILKGHGTSSPFHHIGIAPLAMDADRRNAIVDHVHSLIEQYTDLTPILAAAAKMLIAAAIDVALRNEPDDIVGVHEVLPASELEALRMQHEDGAPDSTVAYLAELSRITNGSDVEMLHDRIRSKVVQMLRTHSTDALFVDI